MNMHSEHQKRVTIILLLKTKTETREKYQYNAIGKMRKESTVKTLKATFMVPKKVQGTLPYKILVC